MDLYAGGTSLGQLLGTGLRRPPSADFLSVPLSAKVGVPTYFHVENGHSFFCFIHLNLRIRLTSRIASHLHLYCEGSIYT